MVCTFFGHRDTPVEIQPMLETVLTDLIENLNADTFYVGNHGSFDILVKNTLKKLKLYYPHINYTVVLAYIPSKKQEFCRDNQSETIYPDGLENTPPKYAIIERNKWMIKKSNYVVTYVNHSFGGAARFKELSEKSGKTVINLADYI